MLLYGDGSKYASRVYLNHYEHTLPLAATLIEFALLGSRVRIKDFYQPCSLGLAYGLFSMYFESQGWKNHLGERTIYPVVDWKSQSVVSGAISVGFVVLMACVHLVLGVVSARNQRAEERLSKKRR